MNCSDIWYIMHPNFFMVLTTVAVLGCSWLLARGSKLWKALMPLVWVRNFCFCHRFFEGNKLWNIGFVLFHNGSVCDYKRTSFSLQLPVPWKNLKTETSNPLWLIATFCLHDWWWNTNPTGRTEKINRTFNSMQWYVWYCLYSHVFFVHCVSDNLTLYLYCILRLFVCPFSNTM